MIGCGDPNECSFLEIGGGNHTADGKAVRSDAGGNASHGNAGEVMVLGDSAEVVVRVALVVARGGCGSGRRQEKINILEGSARLRDEISPQTLVVNVGGGRGSSALAEAGEDIGTKVVGAAGDVAGMVGGGFG